jgi:tetratricopeptide (TPR) repeat protein/tRNA A-37 threonylcarbamoyl transferase component Bud32
MSFDTKQALEIVDKALEISPEERPAYLDSVCQDSSLRQYVESLLGSYEQADDFLSDPALITNASVLESDSVDSWLGRHLGPYQLIEEIGQGGMGAVYRAIRADDQYQKKVAIKLIIAGFDSRYAMARFRSERQILATLEHPNIARLLDGGAADDGAPYFVMELVEGRPIHQYCDAHALSITERLRLFRTVCSAVQYAHQNLVVHRDLKPANILVTFEGIPKLLDFGIAKILDAKSFAGEVEPTVDFLRMLTPEYASPEQVRGEAISTASDVYSLGVVLYLLLTGRRPYRVDGLSPEAMRRAVCETEPARPSAAVRVMEEKKGPDASSEVTLTPESISSARDAKPDKLSRALAGDLDNIVLKSLQKEPQRRYSSVEQFSEDVRRYMEGLPVGARQDTLLYRAGKFVKRNKVPVGAAALLLLSLCSGLAATLWEAHIARVERAKADRRFNDVREVANSLMFEIHDSIKDLPGSTPARKLLVDRSLRYLDNLSREASGDASLQQELAAAYEKVGDVQGNSSQLGLGDTAAALTNYRKALEIRLRLDSSHFKPQNQLAMAADRRWIGVILLNKGDTGSALENANAAIKITERLNRDAPADTGVLREMEQDYQAIALAQGGGGPTGSLGEFNESLANNRKALAVAERLLKIQPNNLEETNQVARYNVRIGDDLHLLGRRSEALEYYRDALHFFETSDSGTNAMQQLRTVVVYSRIADELLANGDAAGSLLNYRKELAILEPLAAADRRNAVLQVHLAASLAGGGRAATKAGDIAAGLAVLERAAKLANEQVAHDPANVEPRVIVATIFDFEGEASASRGRQTEALQQFRHSLSMFEELSKADSKNVDVRLDVAALHTKVGSALAALGRAEEAEHEYREALAIDQGVARSSSPPAEIEYTRADAYFGLGDVQAALAAAARQTDQQIEHWSKARSYYQESLETWKGIPSPAYVSPEGFGCGSPTQSNQALRIADAALAKLRGSTGSKQ